jgi:hypothetical protein
MSENLLSIIVISGAGWRMVGSTLNLIAEQSESHCAAIGSVAMQ